MANTTVEKTIGEAQSAMTVKRAFGEPFEVDGITILPAAEVGGAGGGGGANGGRGGWGTGFRLSSRPIGVFVIDWQGARWVPVSTPNPLTTLFNTVRNLLFGRDVKVVGKPEPKQLPQARPARHAPASRARRARRVAAH